MKNSPLAPTHHPTGRAHPARPTHLIAVVGNSPGVGKSTLCRSLADWLRSTGATVDHFEEADILPRPAFRAVAEEFTGGARDAHQTAQHVRRHLAAVLDVTS
ncbi:hypothetical protein AB0F24_06560 [Streptomyces platensis]|uniref:hypothetical protein n=1 Tax=Streptomyces platensis TaxID=58346 RepID=UPI002E1639FD